MASKNKSMELQTVVSFLLPILVFSFLLPYHVSSVATTTFSFFDLFFFDVDRKALLVFFNAILIFLARDSGLLGVSSAAAAESKLYDEKEKVAEEDQLMSTRSCSKDITVRVEEIQDGDKFGYLQLAVAAEGGAAAEEEMADACNLQINAAADVREVPGDENEEDLDDMNRRFEEFIQRVKEERRLEAIQLVKARSH